MPEKIQLQADPEKIANCIAPHIYKVSSIAKIQKEIFGLVLQIVCWQCCVQTVIEWINALGYGLTLSIQTGIDSLALPLASQAQVGNVCINRNMFTQLLACNRSG